MIAKVFPTGKGGISYLLSKKFCPVLIGDPEITQDLILSSRSKNPSTAGVLTFEEYIEDDQVKLDLCVDFTAKVLAPGIDPSEISIVWVEHKEGDQESPRTGLHFEMSNTHLASGKQLQPYLGRGKKKWQAPIYPRLLAEKALAKSYESRLRPLGPRRTRQAADLYGQHASAGKGQRGQRSYT